MAPGRRRIVTSKPTRNGCRTCRIRRVRCDQERPACKKCTSTGRRCDGYGAGQSPPDSIASARVLRPSVRQEALPLSRAIAPQTSIAAALDDSERCAFDYFLRKTADEIQLFSPEKGWVQLALQLSREAAPVIYAITALGSMHQAQLAVTHATLAQPLAAKEHGLSMRHYSKAIGSLQAYIDKAIFRGAPVEPILLACLLLACLAVMHANGEAAVWHLRSGCQIIRERTELTSCIETEGDHSLSFYSRGITVQLLRTFERLEGMFIQQDEQMQPSVWCQRTNASPDAIQIEPLHPFTFVNEAKMHLDSLIHAGEQAHAELFDVAEAHLSASYGGFLEYPVRYCLIHCLTRVVSLKKHSQLETRIESLLRSHQAWQTAVSELESTYTQHQSRLAIMMLRLRQFSSYFTLSICREAEEAVFDRFLDEYGRVLLIAEQYLEDVAKLSDSSTGRITPAGPERQLTFSLQMGLLPAVNLISFKCREPSIRRRAISLLQRADRREGLFWSGALAAHADAIRDLEKQRLQELCLSGADFALAHEGGIVLPEAARFSEVILAPDLSKGFGSLQIICGRFAHERGQEIEVLRYRGSGYPIRTEKMSQSIISYG